MAYSNGGAFGSIIINPSLWCQAFGGNFTYVNGEIK